MSKTLLKRIKRPEINVTIIDLRGHMVKPVQYSKEKPVAIGSYLCHNKLTGGWFVNRWSGYESYSWGNLVDRYIPYVIEGEDG